MRDNGLRAPSYVAIADLAPEVADTMLTVLAGARVAAYADPCPPVAEPCREIRLPPTPYDRLFVDEGEQDRAKALLGEQLTKIRDGENASSAGAPDAPPDEASADGPVAEAAPSGAGAGEDDHRSDAARMATFDEDRLWAEIVAGYDRVLEDVVPRWPAIEDVEPPAGTTAVTPRPVSVAPATAALRTQTRLATTGESQAAASRTSPRAAGPKATELAAPRPRMGTPGPRTHARPSPRHGRRRNDSSRHLPRRCPAWTR